MFALSSTPREGFKKIYQGVWKIFEKALKMENHPKIIMVVVFRKYSIFGITIKRINKTFSVPRKTLDVYFGISLKLFYQSSACLAVHLPL